MKRKTRDSILVFALAIVLGALALQIGVIAYEEATDSREYDYEYYIKAEQVNEDQMVDNSTDFDRLTDVERELLFRGFKKSDHFLGGATATVEVDEPVGNVSNEWKVVKVEGVPILTAIQGPEQVEADSEIGADMVTVGGFMVVLFLAWLIYHCLRFSLPKLGRAAVNLKA
jgi:hypothetical protein